MHGAGSAMARRSERRSDSAARVSSGSRAVSQAKDHPLADDLKRKDFIAIHELPVRDALGPRFPDLAAARMRDAGGFMRFLCEALDVPF